MNNLQKDLLLAFIKHHMDQDLRQKMAAELPLAYAAWMGISKEKEYKYYTLLTEEEYKDFLTSNKTWIINIYYSAEEACNNTFLSCVNCYELYSKVPLNLKTINDREEVVAFTDQYSLNPAHFGRTVNVTRLGNLVRNR